MSDITLACATSICENAETIKKNLQPLYAELARLRGRVEEVELDAQIREDGLYRIREQCDGHEASRIAGYYLQSGVYDEVRNLRRRAEDAEALLRDTEECKHLELADRDKTIRRLMKDREAAEAGLAKVREVLLTAKRSDRWATTDAQCKEILRIGVNQALALLDSERDNQ